MEGRLGAWTLSIVIVSLNSAALLERCLAALDEQAERSVAEVLVVRDPTTSGEVGRRLRRRFPRVRWLDAPPGSTVPAMRSRPV